MRYSLQLPTDRVEAGPEFTSAAAVAEMARAVEAAGFDAVYVTEHPFPDDRWLAQGGHHALDPFVALAAAATASERLRLHTNILVLAYRNPFLTAKALASLDVLSGGRVIAGVAVGYLEGEYRALGADFDHRNELTDEALDAMRHAWSGGSVVRSGRGFEAAGNTMRPAPLQRPHPPLWIGGNSRRAMRRAVAHGQGWSPFPLPRAFRGRTRTAAIESPAELAGRIRELQGMAREAGRSEPLEVNFVPFGHAMNTRSAFDPGAFRAQAAELAEAGVGWLSLGLPFETRADYLAIVERFSREVIARG